MRGEVGCLLSFVFLQIFFVFIHFYEMHLNRNPFYSYRQNLAGDEAEEVRPAADIETGVGLATPSSRLVAGGGPTPSPSPSTVTKGRNFDRAYSPLAKKSHNDNKGIEMDSELRDFSSNSSSSGHSLHSPLVAEQVKVDSPGLQIFLKNQALKLHISQLF